MYSGSEIGYNVRWAYEERRLTGTKAVDKNECLNAAEKLLQVPSIVCVPKFPTRRRIFVVSRPRTERKFPSSVQNAFLDETRDL
jgi:hypothetical protein